MKCDSCGGNNAVIHIRQIIGSNVRDLHICSNCAAERGILNDGNVEELGLPEILNNLIADIAVGNNSPPEVCPTCGLKGETVDKEGRIGCPDCATIFSKELLGAITRRKLTPGHPGKLPRSLETVKTLIFDRENLRNRLKKAVEEEDYETAALLRDRIQTLEADAGVVP